MARIRNSTAKHAKYAKKKRDSQPQKNDVSGGGGKRQEKSQGNVCQRNNSEKRLFPPAH
jgi:hypothetical protein